MKLYATTKSERASKGQGGNKYIEIDLLCKNEETGRNDIVGRVNMTHRTGGGITMALYSMVSEQDLSINLPDRYTSKGGISKRLEYLRKELRAERISYGELAELQSLAQYIDKNDVELLEAAGVPEFEGEKMERCFNCTEYAAEKTELGDWHCSKCGIYSKNNKEAYQEKGEQQKGEKVCECCNGVGGEHTPSCYNKKHFIYQ